MSSSKGFTTRRQSTMHYGDSEIKLSIALVTRNRPASLERTLKSLRAQEVQPWEVIVSDDSDANHISEVQRITLAYGCEYLTGPRLGLYANRNHVAAACRGTHIRTMDDDHEFPKNHFEECLVAIQHDLDSVWVIGEFLSHKAITASPPPCPGQLHPRGFSVAPTDSQNCWAIADGSCIFPANIFRSGNRYVESFKFGSSFLELGSRLFWLGYRIRFLETTYILHHTMEFQETGETVWFASSSTAMASRLFAMLCHSFIYQPSFINKTLTCLQITKDIMFHGKLVVNSIQVVLHAYKNQQRMLKSCTHVFTQRN